LPRALSNEALLVIVSLVVMAALGLLGLRRVVRRRRARQGPARRDAPTGPFGSRREQMAAWSAAVRAALASRFGDHWRARTTEEIAADVDLAEALGGERREELVQFLARADLAKFDDREGLQPPLPDPPGAPLWMVEFVAAAASAPAAGASSRIKGK
jgi:hypothetical protein